MLTDEYLYNFSVDNDFSYEMLVKKNKELNNPVETVKYAIKHSREFINQYQLPNLLTLLKIVKYEYKFTGDEVDYLCIEAIIRHCVKEFDVSNTELEKTYKAIADYCFTKGETTYADFKKYLLKSKVLKHCNIPLSVIEKKTKEYAKQLQEWFPEGESEND